MPERTARKACVIGWPIEHSRSPLIHRYWLSRLGVPGDYDKRAVAPEDLRDFLLNLPAAGYAGCNVTIPHKERAFRIVSEENPSGVGEMGRRLKAVNTIWLENGRLHADNTDAYGFMANFRRACPKWRARDAHVVILGAGGAARAVALGFADAGAGTVTIANRTREKAERLARELGGPMKAAGLESLPGLLEGADALVNATSLGMAGQPPLNVPLERLPSEAVVADIVYVPLETELLRAAAARGLRTVDGLGMLLHQAAPGFEKWFGRRPEVDAPLRRLVEEDVKSSC